VYQLGKKFWNVKLRYLNQPLVLTNKSLSWPSCNERTENVENFGSQNLDENMQMAPFKRHKKETGDSYRVHQEPGGTKGMVTRTPDQTKASGYSHMLIGYTIQQGCDCWTTWTNLSVLRGTHYETDCHVAPSNKVLCLVRLKGSYGADITKENRLGTVMLQELFNVQSNHSNLVQGYSKWLSGF
jgi:hypothetical protein